MKPYSIRVPEEVQGKLKKMDTDYIRKVLIEVAGMTYVEEKKLVFIEDLVKKYIKENLGNMEIQKAEVDDGITEKAINSIMDIMQ